MMMMINDGWGEGLEGLIYWYCFVIVAIAIVVVVIVNAHLEQYNMKME